MVLCQRYGHEIVALANLLPDDAAVDDLDSWMYQTVGHQIVEAYAACTGLPLFRRKIRGTSHHKGLVYRDTQGDEVEDLAALLAYIKLVMPEVTAVTCGAIASDYQRTRVERVCTRLGLVSLAYLWHQPQEALLQQMIDSNIEAVLVKVAALGLCPQKHLGVSLRQVQPYLVELRDRFGSNICGEGGEYETLTLDCPQVLPYGRIVLDSWSPILVSPDNIAPVALLHPKAFHIEWKNRQHDCGRDSIIDVPEDFHCAIEKTLLASINHNAPQEEDIRLHIINSVCTVSIAAVVFNDAEHIFTGHSLLERALQAIQSRLRASGVAWENALHVHVYLPHMADFVEANQVYSRYFPPIDPPARATVQLNTKSDVSLSIEVLFGRENANKKVLHVQSISQWAPSCIGPYAQAVTCAGIVYFAGQIALDPPTMEIVSGGIEAQVKRCIDSCQAVAVAAKSDLHTALLWACVYVSTASNAQYAGAQLSTYLFSRGHPNELSDESERRDSYLSILEQEIPKTWEPIILYVTVPGLPRSALVEIQPTCMALDDPFLVENDPYSSSCSSENDEEHFSQEQRRRRSRTPWQLQLERKDSGYVGTVQVSSLISKGCLCRVVVSLGEKRDADTYIKEALAVAELQVDDIVYCRLYYVPGEVENYEAAADCISVCGAPCTVPVNAVGLDPTQNAAILIDVYAYR